MTYKKILTVFLTVSILYSSLFLNSTGQIIHRPPDLLSDTISVEPSDPVVYENVTIRVTVKNIGGTASPSVRGRLYIDSTIQNVTIPSINVGHKATLTFYWVPEESKTYTIYFIADCDQAINELNESNNVISTNVSIREGEFDLKADMIIYLPEIPVLGQNISFKAKVVNTGTRASLPCIGVFYVNNQKIAAVNIGSITVGGFTITEPVTWITEEPGVYTIRFWVDSTVLMEEIDEYNNNVSISLNISSTDTNPPLVTVAHHPEEVTERDNVTFIVNATDESGIRYVYVTAYTLSPPVYFSNISYDKESFTYTCGPFNRKSRVYYYAEAEDKAGNHYRTDTYNFTVESYYKENLTVEISSSPVNPTEFDEIYLTAKAMYPYGVAELSILNYKDNHTMKRKMNATELTVGPLGPFTAGTELRYWAKAVDVDGNTVYSSVLNIRIGEVGFRNRKNTSAYENGMVFLIPDTDWRAVLSIVPIAIWREYNDSSSSLQPLLRHVIKPPRQPSHVVFPVLVYHYENDSAVDVKPVINFLNYRWVDSKVIIIGNPPSYLIEKLVAPKPIGAGLNENNITILTSNYSETLLNIRVNRDASNIKEAIQKRWNLNLILNPAGDTISNRSVKGFSNQFLYQLRCRYWTEVNKVVITEDEYSVALEAALYASMINAPLLFKGRYSNEEIRSKRVVLVGEFNEEEVEDIEQCAHLEGRYTLKELQHLIIRAGARNIILVNPLDQWIGFYKKNSGLGFTRFYYKQSLLSPFLAAAKNAVIVETPTLSYTEADKTLQDFIDESALSNYTVSIIIMASPSSIPMARPNSYHTPELEDDWVYFEVFNYNDLDIKKVNIETGENSIYSFAGHQFAPVYTDNCLIVETEDGYSLIKGNSIGRLYIYSSCTPRSHGGYLVYSKQRGVSLNDIFIVASRGCRDLTYRETAAVNTSADEVNPDVFYSQSENYGYIVWQQRENEYDDWDIHYTLFREERPDIFWYGTNIPLTIEGNQINPSIYNGRIVYQDDRNGDWDIYLHDIGSQSQFESTRITNNPGQQIQPDIYRDIIVWQDNRNGNWDIYMHDLSTGLTTGLATSPNPEVKPRINNRWIVWYERTDDGLWHLWAYEINTGLKKEIDKTEVSHEDSLLFLQVDNKFYSSKNNDGYMNYPTGRIFGLSTSDLSAYVFTDILFDKMKKNRDALIIARGLNKEEKENNLLNYTNTFWTDDVKNEFINYEVYTTYAGVESHHSRIIDKFSNAYLTTFYDHGWAEGLEGFISSHDLENGNYSEVPSFLLLTGCLTAAYYSTSNKQWLLVTHLLRSGRIGCYGFVDLGVSTYIDGTILSDGHCLNPYVLNIAFLRNQTIGEAYRTGKNQNLVNPYVGSDVVILLGDPTVKPRWWP